MPSVDSQGLLLGALLKKDRLMREKQAVINDSVEG